MKASSLLGFDEHITRRMLGYTDVDKYYEEISR